MKPSSNTKQAIFEVLTVLMMIQMFLVMTCQLAKAVKTPILCSCVLCNLAHFLYSPDQISMMRTIFPRYYTFPRFALIWVVPTKI